ncbi:Actin-binding Rho-activating protein, partial [Gryllus bimaculatus]
PLRREPRHSPGSRCTRADADYNYRARRRKYAPAGWGWRRVGEGLFRAAAAAASAPSLSAPPRVGSGAAMSKPYGDLLFNQQANRHSEGQARNPFSQAGGVNLLGKPKWDKNDAEYGRPVAGSKTDIRGKRAHSHITKEILELCEIINENGEQIEGQVVISFGELFNIYTHISNKVVGLLLRGRKQKIVDFEGETLFQEDDDVPIMLLKSIEEIRGHFKALQEEKEKEDKNGGN